MNSIKKVMGIIFAALFVLTAVPALVFFNFDRRAFTAETYQTAFVNIDFYNKLPIIMAQAAISPNSSLSQDTPMLMQGMNQSTWETFFRALLPPEDLKKIGMDLLDSTFAYLNMQSDTVQLSLAPIKTRMAGDAGVQSVFAILNTLPECTMEQLAHMMFDAISGKDQVQYCKFPEKYNAQLSIIIHEQMSAAASTLPDQMTLVSNPTSSENNSRIKLKYTRITMRLSPILPLVFLLLMTVLTANSLKNWLKWWSLPLFITGFLASLVGLVGTPIFGEFFKQFFVNDMPEYLQKYANELVSVVLKALFAPIFWQGLIIAFIGLTMAVSAYFISRNQKPTDISSQINQPTA